jgi:predicted nucleic acid-binding protein
VFREIAGPATVRGNLVPDAHLVALMRQNDVSTIYSHDRDFRRFDGLEVIDPLD